MESVTGDFFASIPVEACPFAIAPEKLLRAQLRRARMARKLELGV